MHILPAMFPTLTRNAVDLPMPRLIGAKRTQPYQPRRFTNISGMSFGALSPNAVRALSRGAKLAECYMSTGEGSLSPYHVEGGGDILYQIGPAKFGCRTDDGRFDDEKAAAIMALAQVKMIEIKLAQGAKPGKGGLLPKRRSRQRLRPSVGSQWESTVIPQTGSRSSTMRRRCSTSSRECGSSQVSPSA
jgi:glutamate synthase domain-containing protein 2